MAVDPLCMYIYACRPYPAFRLVASQTQSRDLSRLRLSCHTSHPILRGITESTKAGRRLPGPTSRHESRSTNSSRHEIGGEMITDINIFDALALADMACYLMHISHYQGLPTHPLPLPSQTAQRRQIRSLL